MSGPERRRNLCDAFDVRSVAGMSLLLVDDVTTSGATLTELARVLKRAGARQVTALTVAFAGSGVLPSR
jgi:predicted amidophosphoribosyltransferase